MFSLIHGKQNTCCHAIRNNLHNANENGSDDDAGDDDDDNNDDEEDDVGDDDDVGDGK